MTEPVRVFRIDGFDESASGHLVERLTPTPGPPSAGRVQRLNLWGEGANSGRPGEAELQRLLLLPDHSLEPKGLLQLLAGDEGKVEFAMREVGGAGGIDVIARVGRTLLLVDCKGSCRKREEWAQAERNALAAVGNIHLADRPERVVLILLERWSSKTRPDISRPPIWFASTSETKPLEITLRQRWGFEGFVDLGNSHVVFGEWNALRALLGKMNFSGSAPARELWCERPTSVGGHDFEVEAERAGRAGRLRCCLMVKAEVHRAALLGSDPLATLRDRAALQESRECGWIFRGETNDKGFVRLVWERTIGGRADALCEGTTDRPADALLRWIRGVLEPTSR